MLNIASDISCYGDMTLTHPHAPTVRHRDIKKKGRKRTEQRSTSAPHSRTNIKEEVNKKGSMRHGCKLTSSRKNGGPLLRNMSEWKRLGYYSSKTTRKTPRTAATIKTSASTRHLLEVYFACGPKKSREKKLGAFDDEDEVQGCVAVSTPLLSTAIVCRLKNKTVHTLRKVLRRWEMGVKSKAG
jgi:hypothetical protein